MIITEGNMDSLSNQQLSNKNGQLVSAESVLQEVDIICFYFSAHWCPPCRQFTPVLADFYTELKDDNAKIEIIFISSDRSENDMKTYMNDSHGDWLALPWGSPTSSLLKQKYKVSGIPCLIVVKKDGTIISTDGRSDVHRKGTACFREWSK